ncbi:MAG: hypothetical protein V3W18_14630 [candidate division Zixibacteria bacterium]
MIKFSLNRILMVLGMILAFTIVASAQQSSTACEPYGSVTIKGDPAEDNMTVVAYVGEIELARTQTSGGQYSLYIDQDDSDTPQRDGYLPGDIITIRVNGEQANPAFEAFTGRQRRDIEVITLDIQSESWGRIKALFR